MKRKFRVLLSHAFLAVICSGMSHTGIAQSLSDRLDQRQGKLPENLAHLVEYMKTLKYVYCVKNDSGWRIDHFNATLDHQLTSEGQGCPPKVQSVDGDCHARFWRLSFAVSSDLKRVKLIDIDAQRISDHQKDAFEHFKERIPDRGWAGRDYGFCPLVPQGNLLSFKSPGVTYGCPDNLKSYREGRTEAQRGVYVELSRGFESVVTARYMYPRNEYLKRFPWEREGTARQNKPNYSTAHNFTTYSADFNLEWVDLNTAEKLSCVIKPLNEKMLLDRLDFYRYR